MIELFGQTIRETKDAFKRPHLGSNQPAASSEDRIKVIGRIIVSCLLLLLTVYLYMIKKTDVAGTIIGALIGYWVK